MIWLPHRSACRPVLLLAAMLFCGATMRSQQSQPGLSGSTGTQEDVIDASHSTDPLLHNQERLVTQGRYADAERGITAYLSSHVDSADAHFLLGYVLYREDQPQRSLAEYTLAAHFRRPAAKDLAMVAMDYILLRDYHDADTWLTMATTWSPETALYWYYLGRTKYNENRFQEAIDAFKKCLALHPRDVRAEYNLGLTYAGLNRNDEAASAYETAIAWQSGAAQQDPQPDLDYGILLLQQGETDKALTHLQRAVSLDGRNPRAHEQLGRTYEKLYRLADADAEISNALSLAPNVPSLHFEMGRIYQREGKAEKAKQEFARCAALNATHSTDASETPNPDPRK